jgi:hypothetical protein
MQVDIAYRILFLLVLLLSVGFVLRSSESSACCRTMPLSAQRSQYQVGLFSLAFHVLILSQRTLLTLADVTILVHSCKHVQLT